MTDRRGPGWGVADLGDVKLEYEVAGEGPDLVWLHGLSGNMEMDRRMVEPLTDEFRVTWYSSRGHGRSSAVLEAEMYRYELFARDLERLLDVLGLERPLLAGGSHGANTLLRHEADFPGRARALLLAAPGGNALQRPEPGTVAALRQWTEFGESQGRKGLALVATGSDPDDPGADPEVVAAFDTNDLASIAAAMKLVIDQNAVDPAALPGFDVPTHVAAWDADPVIHPIATARVIASLIPGATFAEIERPAGLPPAEAAAAGAMLLREWARGAVAASVANAG